MDKKVFLLIVFVLYGLVLVSAHQDPDDDEDNYVPLFPDSDSESDSDTEDLDLKSDLTDADKKASIDNYLKDHDEGRKMLDEWHKLKKKVFFFLGSNEIYPPDEIMNDVKRMGDIFSALSPKDLIHEDERWCGRRLRRINELRNLNEADCSVDAFVEIGRATYPDWDLSKSVLAYLDLVGRRQYGNCKPQFEQELEKAVSRFTEEQLKDIKKFSEEGLNSSEVASFRIFSKEPSDIFVGQGALKILKSRNVELSKNISFGKLGQLLLSSVGKLCRSVKAELKAVVDKHYTIMSNIHADDSVGQKTSEWLYIYGMCDLFDRKPARIVRGVQKVLLEPPKDG